MKMKLDKSSRPAGEGEWCVYNLNGIRHLVKVVEREGELAYVEFLDPFPIHTFQGNSLNAKEIARLIAKFK